MGDLLLESVGVALRDRLDSGRWSVGVHGSGESCYLLVHRIVRDGGNSWGLSVLSVQRLGGFLVVRDLNLSRESLVFEFGDPGFDVGGFVGGLVGVVEREFWGDGI